MPISYATLAVVVIAVLLISGILAWWHVFLCGLRHCSMRPVAPDGEGLLETLADRDFRSEHRNHLHFADLCFLGAAAVTASLYLHD